MLYSLQYLFRMNRIFWSPCENSALTKIMSNVASKYGMYQQCYANSETLNVELQRYTAISYVGVQFDDSLAGKATLDKKMRVTLRYVDLNAFIQLCILLNKILDILENYVQGRLYFLTG